MLVMEELKQQLINKIKVFPLLVASCSDYITWVTDNVKEGLEKYDFVRYIQEHSPAEIEDMLENRLQKAKQILRMTIPSPKPG